MKYYFCIFYNTLSVLLHMLSCNICISIKNDKISVMLAVLAFLLHYDKKIEHIKATRL